MQRKKEKRQDVISTAIREPLRLRNNSGAFFVCKITIALFEQIMYNTSMNKQPLYKHFFDNLEHANTGCWLWKKGFTSGGYGLIGSRESSMRAHRFSWIIHFGNIPKGLFVCHSCDNPPCVNPQHLFLGTIEDNNEDRHQKFVLRYEGSSRKELQIIKEGKLLPLRVWANIRHCSDSWIYKMCREKALRFELIEGRHFLYAEDIRKPIQRSVSSKDAGIIIKDNSILPVS